MTTYTASTVPSTAVGMDASARRVDGLDSIRFACALLVMMDHIGLMKDRLHGDTASGLAKAAIGVLNSLFNGPAAVIVFFIVSGFCIHFPFSGQRKLSVGEFYTRRFFRICPPAIIFFLLLWYGFKIKLSPLDTVLWSVICECVYYLAYPALLYLRRKFSWPALIAAATCIAILLLAIRFHSLNDGSWSYVALGPLTCIVGLPCWLIGCWLAENYTRFSVPSTAKIWLMRVGIFTLSVMLEVFHFHAHNFLASNYILLDLFSLPACWWIGTEIAYASKHPRVALLEWAGGWSYSLYLIHPLARPALAMLSLSLLMNPRLHFVIPIFALVSSYLFFLVVERPSHRLAVMAGRAIGRKSTI